MARMDTIKLFIKTERKTVVFLVSALVVFIIYGIVFLATKMKGLAVISFLAFLLVFTILVKDVPEAYHRVKAINDELDSAFEEK